MKKEVDERFDAALGGLAGRLLGLAGQVESILERSLVGIGQAAAERAASLTPRAEGPGPHLADAWVAEPRRVGDVFEVVVRNTDPRANEPVTLADGTRTKYSVLHVLEHGSRAHWIRPVRGRFLVFGNRYGETVRAKAVWHPGTRPYAMLGLARVDAAVDIKRTLDALSAAVRLALLGKGSRLRRPNPFGGTV